MKEIHLN